MQSILRCFEQLTCRLVLSPGHWHLCMRGHADRTMGLSRRCPAQVLPPNTTTGISACANTESSLWQQCWMALMVERMSKLLRTSVGQVAFSQHAGRAHVHRWSWARSCWWTRWAASAPSRRRRGAGASPTVWSYWWGPARGACPRLARRTCSTPSRPSTGAPDVAQVSTWRAWSRAASLCGWYCWVDAV